MTGRVRVPAAKPDAAEPAASVELETLARQVAALRLCWSDPWRFFETRSDLAARLRRLARWAREAELRVSAEAER